MNWRERIEAELELCSGSAKNENWYQVVEKITDVIDRYPEDSVKIGLDLILKSWHWKPWSSINLDKENFDKLGRHKRAWYIQKDNNGIYNVLAYTLKQRKVYLINSNGEGNEIPLNKATLNAEGECIDERIYISRGGIVNGDYVHKSYLLNQIDNYNIKDPIKIPVSTIEYTYCPEIIFVVDHREPKLKALIEFYNVPIEHDENVKYNLRKFKKIKSWQ